MSNPIIISKLHVWLVLCCLVLISVGVTHFCYYPDPEAVERGLGAIALAILLPLGTFYFKWMIKKYPSKVEYYPTKKQDKPLDFDLRGLE